MKTFYKSFFITLVLIVNSFTFIQAQLCVDITAALEPDGTYILDPAQILNVELQPDQSLLAYRLYFTCEDLGQYIPVTLYIVDSDDTTYLCTQNVLVLDSTPPVARCKSDLHVQLNENGEYRFAYTDVNDGSYDLCTEVVTQKFFPDRIRCTDPNPLDVLMVVRDLAGNVDTCTVRVSYDDYDGITDPIECKDSLTFYLPDWENDSQIEITPDKVWVRGVHGCILNYSIDLYDGATLKPDDFITIEDTLNTITAVLTDLENAGECTTVITVDGFNDPCDPLPPLLCDTMCNSTPFGDCASGHTDEDLVELPCDVFITEWCALSEIYPDPEFIEWVGYPGADNAWPKSGPDFITTEENVGSIFVGYWDKVFDLPIGQRIERNWTVLDWCTQQTIEYKQNIFVLFDLTEICDTLPWNAPAGDCQSGHTMSDDIEWPADITIHSIFSHPDDLALNPEVQFENIRPRLNQECILNGLLFQDTVTQLNDTTLRIERTWHVIDWYSVELWQYVQIITVIHEALGSTVCATIETGEPIPGVELIPGVFTDNSGCHEFPDPDGIIVTPVKNSPFRDGVNILDLIILMEEMLGIRPMSKFQRYAADLNNSQGLSAIDLVEFNKLIFGNFIPYWSRAWKFIEQTTQQVSVDISDPLVPYKVIGFKMGDLDNSYIINPDLDDIILRTEDDVLNAGETYYVPFYLERNENLAGFAVRLKNENNNLDFLNVTAPNISGFDPGYNVAHFSDGISIQWVTPMQHLLSGIAVDSTEALFILEIRANENIILNEHLSLEVTFDNVLKPSGIDAPLEIRLAWEDVVVSSVVDLGNGRKIEFYPNPATEIIHLKGITADEEGKITIIDPTGRIAFEENMQTSLDISRLHVGMYYIVFTIDGKKSAAAPLVKF